MKTSFSDASLLLIGHGSTANAESAAPTYQHATTLRQRGLFAQVREAFWKQEPGIAAVLASVSARRVFAVPLFISEGYFTEEAIPQALGLCLSGQTQFARVQDQGDRTLYYTAPVGTHPSMTSVILARAREVVERHPFPRAPRPQETALFLAAHGTERNENSRRAVEHQVTLIRAAGIYPEVHAIFMEEAPRIGDCYTMAVAKHLVVVPFFISDGLHVCEDIPILLGEAERLVHQRLQNGQATWRNPTERKGKLVWFSRSVGTEPHLADVILERVEQAQAWEVGSPAPVADPH